jgi:pyruvate dehydrogenase E1 component alpha subunit
MRVFEETAANLWAGGLISGELHLGIGEEGIVAGVVDHLTEGDALALDHRSTPPLVGRGANLESLFLELLGHPDGIGGGCGGHMHLFDRTLLTASSGIVGASAPTACGFALAHQHLRPGRVAVAFLGESAVNQGMVMEAFNLAAVWRLPVVFVVKDNGWAVSTRSSRMTGGNPIRRAAAFGMPAVKIDGSDTVEVWKAARSVIQRARSGKGPGYLHATCHRPHGHFEDDPVLRRVGEPRVLAEDARQLLRAARGTGQPVGARLAGLAAVARTIAAAAMIRPGRGDPLRNAARHLDNALALDRRAQDEVEAAADAALAKVGVPE